MTHLYVCRHGESQANLEERYAGHIDTPLTDRGRRQAEQAASHAVKLGLDLIVASPLVRALETARIIAHDINYPESKIVTNDLFKERYLGSLQGQPFSIPYDPDQFPDVESDSALHTRALAALDYLHSLPAERILLVSHGDFLNTLRNIMTPDAAYDELPNAQIIQLI